MRILFTIPTIILLVVFIVQGPAPGQVPVFVDDFTVSADSNVLNLEFDSRQTGGLAPIAWVANTLNFPDDPLHQVFSASTAAEQPLQLKEDNTNKPEDEGCEQREDCEHGHPTMVSPDHNFKGAGIVGKRITFDLDVAAFADETGEDAVGRYVVAGITIGASTTLVDGDHRHEMTGINPATEYLTVQFVEDSYNNPNAPDSFIQILEAKTFNPNCSPHCCVCRRNHSGGLGTFSVQLDIDDPVDGDPWDGVGSTLIKISVNGDLTLTYEKLDGGYSDNFITLYTSRNFDGNTLAWSTFDNFTVFAESDANIEAEPQISGDCNQDGEYDLSDVICMLGHLFQDNPEFLPCPTDEGNRSLIDCNGDGDIDLSDSIYTLAFLFQGGPPPILGTACALMQCPGNPGCP